MVPDNDTSLEFVSLGLETELMLPNETGHDSGAGPAGCTAGLSTYVYLHVMCMTRGLYRIYTMAPVEFRESSSDSR